MTDETKEKPQQSAPPAPPVVVQLALLLMGPFRPLFGALLTLEGLGFLVLIFNERLGLRLSLEAQLVLGGFLLGFVLLTSVKEAFIARAQAVAAVAMHRANGRAAVAMHQASARVGVSQVPTKKEK